MSKLIAVRLAVMGFGLLASMAAGSEPASEKSEGPTHTLPRYLVEVAGEGKETFPLNAHTTLNVTVRSTGSEPVAITSLGFDARMPDHKHGMVTTPKVTKLAEDRFKIEGVKLHMKGKWLLEFAIQDAAGETFFASPIHIK